MEKREKREPSPPPRSAKHNKSKFFIRFIFLSYFLLSSISHLSQSSNISSFLCASYRISFAIHNIQQQQHNSLDRIRQIHATQYKKRIKGANQRELSRERISTILNRQQQTARRLSKKKKRHEEEK